MPLQIPDDSDTTLRTTFPHLSDNAGQSHVQLMNKCRTALAHCVSSRVGEYPTAPIHRFHRLIKAFVFTAIVFPRLDTQIFPGWFGKLDAPYMGYSSMLYIENMFHNPIRVVFLAYLMQRRLVWHQVHSPTQRPKCHQRYCRTSPR